MILKVARLGHPVLRNLAQRVAPEHINTPEFQRLLDDMVDTMREYVGVGLAGPQVHLPLRVAVLEVEKHPRYPEMPSVPLTFLINPEVTILDQTPIEDWEGCLSIPEMRGRVPRFTQLRVTGLDVMARRSISWRAIFTPAWCSTRMIISMAMFISIG